MNEEERAAHSAASFFAAAPTRRRAPVSTGGGSVNELAPVPNVVREDVFAEAIGRRVERTAAVDLRELLDEIHQHRIGGEHERRDRNPGAAAAIRLLERAIDDLHVESERIRV